MRKLAGYSVAGHLDGLQVSYCLQSKMFSHTSNAAMRDRLFVIFVGKVQNYISIGADWTAKLIVNCNN